MQTVRTSALPALSDADDLAPVNRFYVTVELATGAEVARGVEIVYQREYERCRLIETRMSEDTEVATVTGYSFQGYEGAVENARRVAWCHR